MKSLVPVESVERRIFLIRGQRVMLDSDLAELYGVTTFNLNKAVKRNRDRFPGDFMFRLSGEEWKNLRFQIGISSSPAWGGRRHPPYAFSEQGVAMLSSVLRSKKAIHVNIAIMRAFVKLRETLALHKQLSGKLEELEKKILRHDAQIQSVFAAIHQLMSPPEKPVSKMGFQPPGSRGFKDASRRKITTRVHS